MPLTISTHNPGFKQQLTSNSFSASDPNRLLKQAIWGYFILLIFEGALRKWFLPGLATPLLLVRDPLAIWIVIKSIQRGLFNSNIYLTGTVVIGIIGIFIAIFLGHGSLSVAIYGARALLIHFPLIFAIGRIFTRDDVLKMGRFTLWLSIPMTFLIAVQFYSPQSAWVNRGVGGDIEGAGFGGALDFMRPPGTFSFTNGTTLFYDLVCCFIIYFWFSGDRINRLILISSTVGLLAAIPLSISRSLLFQVCVSLVFAVFTSFHKPKYFGRLLLTGIGIVIMLFVLSHYNFFQTGIKAFDARFESANEQEGGLQGVIGGRYLGGMIYSVTRALDFPLWGYGIGAFTNVGAILLTGSQKYLISDQEWERIIGELGPLLGLALIFIRLGFGIKLAIACYQKLVSHFLPWILVSFGFLTIVQAQWAQPTSLGFCTIICGLIIASLRKSKNMNP